MNREFFRRFIRRVHRREFYKNREKEADYCRDCGDGDVFLELHHRSGRWLDGSPKNLIPLCHSCHLRRHRRERINGRLDEMKKDIEQHGFELSPSDSIDEALNNLREAASTIFSSSGSGVGSASTTAGGSSGGTTMSMKQVRETMPQSTTDVLEALKEHIVETEQPIGTASDVAERVDIGRRTVLERLNTLSEVGILGSKKIGAGGRVFWPPEIVEEYLERLQEDVDDHPPDAGGVDETPEPYSYDNLSEDLEGVEFPSTKSQEQIEDAIMAVRGYLRDTGPASMRQIVLDVMPRFPIGYEPPDDLERGERYRGAWWRKVVRPGLETIDGVEFDESSRKWRLVD